jgi:hypothetical protein
MADKILSPKTRLNCKWTLWFDDYNPILKNTTKDYEKNLYLVSSFDCIEVAYHLKKNP